MIVDAFLGMPNGLTIDFEEGLLCWTDGGAAMTQSRPAVTPKVNALIGSVRVSSSYEILPSTLTQTEPIGQQVTSSGQLEFWDPKVIKKAEFGQGYQEK